MNETTSVAAEPWSIRRRKTQLAVLGLAIALIAVGAGAYWALYASRHVSTDNAYAAAEVAQITPSVGGTVLQVLVKDTQAVRKGDVLVRIDPTDARLAVAAAEAELDRTLRRVRSYGANDRLLADQIAAREADEQRAAALLAGAQADLERAKIDLQRRQALVGSGSVSAEELTRAQNAHAAAVAQAAAAKAATVQARAQSRAALAAQQVNATLIAQTTVDSHPEVLAARTKLQQAQVDLARTAIAAPVAGVVAKRQVQIGQRVQPGEPLMAVVPVEEMYVDANFKEVQLQKVRVGQPVKLQADLYGSDVTYRGVVEGFSGGSGSAFAAIPAQNATGNWIKVVQRLPVRVKLDPTELKAHPLRVGLSMKVEIDTGHAPAPADADTAQNAPAAQ